MMGLLKSALRMAPGFRQAKKVRDKILHIRRLLEDDRKRMGDGALTSAVAAPQRAREVQPLPIIDPATVVQRKIEIMAFPIEQIPYRNKSKE